MLKVGTNRKWSIIWPTLRNLNRPKSLLKRRPSRRHLSRRRKFREREVKAEAKQPARKNGAKAAPAAAEAPAAAVRTGRKIYSSKERAQKLGQIEKSIGSGETLKSAARQAGISEQTYYQWKKAATPPSDGGDLKDLLALEDENKRLKGLLAERLRKENAELKKKLGLA
ncbi:transposase (plasmid) [Mesorhizobium sp. B2-1-8]|uniref:transposase n=1 Tax=Mesorhizobium sp. B2-1-8 TaxID=2589967 RepID=UPI001D1288B4|nr:transposase [Mesorhizobium sp. B2-1-8]UCI22907.1 transposase [Mesorhizobium sp. B2-1-8]